MKDDQTMESKMQNVDVDPAVITLDEQLGIHGTVDTKKFNQEMGEFFQDACRTNITGGTNIGGRSVF